MTVPIGPDYGGHPLRWMGTVIRADDEGDLMPKTPIGCVLLVVKIAVLVIVLAVAAFFVKRWYDDSGKDTQSQIQKCQAEAKDLAAKAACLTK